jgi:hypothetical protein
MGISLGLNYGNLNTVNVPPDGIIYQPISSPTGGIFFKYKTNRWNFNSGLYISQRGSLVTYPNGSDNQKLPQYFGFYEWPICLSRSFFNTRFEFGVGIVNAFKASYAIHLIGEKQYEIDFKSIILWNINKHLELEASYLFGGLNNAFFKSEAYLFSVFNISLGYSFLNISKNDN